MGWSLLESKGIGPSLLRECGVATFSILTIARRLESSQELRSVL